MFGAGHHGTGRSGPGPRCELDLGAQDSGARLQDVGAGKLAGPQCGWQHRGALLPERHLHVLARRQGFHRMAQAPDPVGVDETRESPLVPENLGQQAAVLPGPFPVYRIVGTHHGVHTGLDGTAKVWKVSLVKDVLGHTDVDLEPCLLHRVEREVLHARDHPRLGAFGCRRTHFAEQ
jgi:hypothetical protein